jgi:signal transduction histidine kinase
MNGNIGFGVVNLTSSKRIMIVASILIGVLIVDTSLVRTFELVPYSSISNWSITLFVLIGAMYTLGQYLLLRFIKATTRDIPQRNKQSLKHRTATIVQYVLGAILAVVILQMVFASQYNVNFLSLATTLSYVFAVIMISVLAIRFAAWYKSDRNYVILLYSLASVALAINMAFLLVFSDAVLQGKPTVIGPHTGTGGYSVAPGSAMSIVNYAYFMTYLASFLLIWGATAKLLHHRSQKIGLIKYWLIVCTPLLYFLSQFVSTFLNSFSLLLSSDPFFYGFVLTLIYLFSKPAGGILFGIAFWMMGKNLPHKSIVKDYLTISACGIIIFFISNQGVTISNAYYPPFGLATVSAMGLSSYMILIGIYYSAASVAQDNKLRKWIRDKSLEESKLLVSIGSAQMEYEIEKRVVRGAQKERDDLARSAGVESSLGESDIRSYVKSVVKEIKLFQDVNQILEKGRLILENSNKFSSCSLSGSMRLAYNNYFEVYREVMDRHKNGQHKGITWVTYIDASNIDLVKKFLEIGVEIKHVKNMPPIDFSVSDKQIIATLEKADSGDKIKSLLVSNEEPYIDHFTSIFEELWRHGIDANSRIFDIEEGRDTEGIEVIHNPAEIQKLAVELVKSARQEVLIIFSTANAFHRQEYAGSMKLLKEAIEVYGIVVKILTPGDEDIVQTVVRLSLKYEKDDKSKDKGQNKAQLSSPVVSENMKIRYIEPHLQTRVSILVVDKKSSLVVELKDDTKDSSVGAIGLATYSNSKATVLSYVSIFETLWIQSELNEQLKVNDKVQKEFINIAAHELRTPIQPIIGLAQLLRSKQVSEERAHELLDVIIRNSKRLQRLTEDILDVTRIEGRSFKLQKEWFSLQEIILNTIADNQTLIERENKKDKVKLELVTKEEIQVEADKLRVSQVISNLISNAIKFTSNGKISISLERKEVRGNKVVLVSVKDTDGGIDPEILPRLFTKFATKSPEGTGLGLYIAKNIVQAHGGIIYAENNDNAEDDNSNVGPQDNEKQSRGATFYFTLPISPFREKVS